MSIRIGICTKAAEQFYPAGLAGSIHFYMERDHVREEWNRGYGILFARGVINNVDVIVPKTVAEPRLWMNEDGTYSIAALRREEDGSAEQQMICCMWNTSDFIHFTELETGNLPKEYETAADTLMVEEDMAEAAGKYWAPVSGRSRFSGLKARGFADPVFFSWEGKWYFLSTNDNVEDIGLYIREGDTIEELMEDTARLYLILDKDEEKGFCQTFWAPEAHVIGGELYILFAVSSGVWGPCCHSMRLKKGCSPVLVSSWETPRPMLRRDGTLLTRPEGSLSEAEKKLLPAAGLRSLENRYGISLDMTYLKAGERSYMVWSYRAGIGSPLDTGSMIMIGEIDEKEPWKLITDPVVIARPVYGYENVRGTINNEGPYAYVRDGVIHLFYSGGDARGYLYIINVLTAPEDGDLLDASVWEKRCTPVGNFTTWTGKYGPGHNSVFTDENGKQWIAFHCVDAMDGKVISVAVEELPYEKL